MGGPQLGILPTVPHQRPSCQSLNSSKVRNSEIWRTPHQRCGKAWVYFTYGKVYDLESSPGLYPQPNTSVIRTDRTGTSTEAGTEAQWGHAGPGGDLDSGCATWVEGPWESRTFVLERSEWATPGWQAGAGACKEGSSGGCSGRADISREARCELHDPTPASAKKTSVTWPWLWESR